MTSAQKVVLDCSSVARANLATVDHIARLRLGLTRGGCELRLFEPTDELLALIALCGLRVEVQGQAEEREQPGGVQEERDLGDPPL